MSRLIPYPGHELLVKDIVALGKGIGNGYLVARRPAAPILRLDPALTVPVEDIESFLHALEQLLMETGV